MSWNFRYCTTLLSFLSLFFCLALVVGMWSWLLPALPYSFHTASIHGLNGRSPKAFRHASADHWRQGSRRCDGSWTAHLICDIWWHLYSVYINLSNSEPKFRSFQIYQRTFRGSWSHSPWSMLKVRSSVRSGILCHSAAEERVWPFQQDALLSYIWDAGVRWCFSFSYPFWEVGNLACSRRIELSPDSTFYALNPQLGDARKWWQWQPRNSDMWCWVRHSHLNLQIYWNFTNVANQAVMDEK